MGAPQRDFRGEADELCIAAEMVKEVSSANEGQVADLGSTINALSKEVEAARKLEVEPHREKVLAINERYKVIATALTGALDHLKGCVADWKLKEIKEQEAEKKRIRLEAAADIRAAREAEAVGDVPPEPPPVRRVAPPPPSNVARGAFGKSVGRKNWKAEMTDMKLLCQAIIDEKVPADLLAFQTQKAISLARGGIKFDPEVVGIRAWQQEEQSFS